MFRDDYFLIRIWMCIKYRPYRKDMEEKKKKKIILSTTKPYKHAKHRISQQPPTKKKKHLESKNPSHPHTANSTSRFNHR